MRALRRRYGHAVVNTTTDRLREIPLGPGGRAREVLFHDGEWRVTPQNRQRLDLYGGGGGWDQAWYSDYADPMRVAAQTWLDRTFGVQRFTVSINEKGFVRVEQVS